MAFGMMLGTVWHFKGANPQIRVFGVSSFGMTQIRVLHFVLVSFWRAYVLILGVVELGRYQLTIDLKSRYDILGPESFTAATATATAAHYGRTKIRKSFTRKVGPGL